MMEMMIQDSARRDVGVLARLGKPVRLLGLLVGLAAFGPTDAYAASKAVLPIGANYILVHRMMIAAGYRAYRPLPPNISFLSVNQKRDGFKEPLRVAFPEMAWCSGTGWSFCSFYFVRPGKNAINEDDIVEITTTGETPRHLLVVSIASVSHQKVDAEYEAGRVLTDEEAAAAFERYKKEQQGQAGAAPK